MKIACLGNVVYDILAYTDKFPIEDERTNYDELLTGFGGPAANAAFVLTKYNNDVDFYGMVGADAYGSIVKEEFKSYGMDTNHIYTSQNISTPLSYIIISRENKTRTINTYRDSREKKEQKNIRFSTSRYDILYTDGKYPEKFMELKKLNPAAKTIIDAGRFNEKMFEICQDIDYLICSKTFAEDFMKFAKHPMNLGDESINFIMEIMKCSFPKSNIIITAGEKGCYYFNNFGKVENYSIKSDNVVDTNAAGDIFHGAFTHAFVNGKSYEECIQFASLVATKSTEAKGSKMSCPSLEKINNKVKTLNKIVGFE